MVLQPSSIWLVVTYPRRRICGYVFNNRKVIGDHSVLRHRQPPKLRKLTGYHSMLGHHGMAEQRVYLGSHSTEPNEHRHTLK